MVEVLTSEVVERPAERPAHVPLDRVVDVDLYHMPGAHSDLHASWKQLQDTAPTRIVWTPRNGGHWIALGAREIARIYADHEVFSSRITLVPRIHGEMHPLRPTTLDPPEHQRHRRILTRLLSTRTVRGAEPHIRALARDAVARMAPHGRCELIAAYAAMLPVALAARLMDVPLDDMRVLPEYAEDPSQAEAGAQGVMARYASFLRALIRRRRAEPGEDLISVLVASDIDGATLSEDEAVDLATAVLTGGLDTVASSLALMMAALARDPALRRRLVTEPGLIPAAVTEMLRRFPLMTKARLVRCDVEIDGVTLREDDMIVLPPLSGLDESVFENAMAVDLARRQTPNATFGNGPHRCPGAHLAQVELEIMIAEWLTRIPEFEIDPERPAAMKGGVLNAVLALHLRWPA